MQLVDPIVNTHYCFSRSTQTNVKVEEAQEAKESSIDVNKNESKNVKQMEVISSELILSPGSLVIPCTKLSCHYQICQYHYDDLSSIGSPCDSRHDSIVELYCDDEFKLGPELENSHLGLANTDFLDTISMGFVEDIIEDDLDSEMKDDVFLPYSVPSLLLQESLKEQSLDWESIEKELQAENGIQAVAT